MRENSDLLFDEVQDMTAFQMGEAIVLSLFLSAKNGATQCVVRSSVAPKGEKDRVRVASLEKIFPCVRAFESEIADLFGIEFMGSTGERWLPSEIEGFPMRRQVNP